ncbi:hypothetical protein TruAng_004539 [Truncatella angustata]|nr:hypothetical protein TruAng_004539 [Truncatella angustata]
MPPMQVSKDEVFVVSSFIWVDDDQLEGLQPVEVYTTLAAANVAARAILVRHAERCDSKGDADLYKYSHNEDGNGFYYGSVGGGAGIHKIATVRVSKSLISNASSAGPPAREAAKAIKTEVEEDDEVKNEKKKEEVEDDSEVKKEVDDDEEKPKRLTRKAPPKTAVNIQTHRKKIPEGMPDCLAGLKLLFTGTFETMDRKTSIATANKYGAEVISKLEDTDYIVIGTRAGPAKLKKINELELETISEEEFFQILENGLSGEKRTRMINRRLADEEEGPEEDDDEEEEEEKKPRKRAAPHAGPAKKRARR